MAMPFMKWKVVTVKVAALVVALPEALLKTARKRSGCRPAAVAGVV